MTSLTVPTLPTASATGAPPALLGLAAALLLGLNLPARAQVEKFMLGPGSQVGPATKVKATDCVTKPDGTIVCDTKLVNPPGTTPAKPVFSPFRN